MNKQFLYLGLLCAILILTMAFPLSHAMASGPHLPPRPIPTEPAPPPEPPSSEPAGGIYGTSTGPPPNVARAFASGPALGISGTGVDGTVVVGNSFVTVRGASVPSGKTYIVAAWKPATGSLPIGNGGRAFRGPGDNRMAVQITDMQVNAVDSMNLPVERICVDYPAANLAQLPPYGENLQAWDGSVWVTLPTEPSTILANGYYRLCANVPPPVLVKNPIQS